jgi:hypothetical protein
MPRDDEVEDTVNFQVTILKVLVSYPDGFAPLEDIKRDLAFFATVGKDWADQTKRMAARVPSLEIWPQGLIERRDGGWRITEKGRAVLDIMEGRVAVAGPEPVAETAPVPERVSSLPAPGETRVPPALASRLRRHDRSQRKRRRPKRNVSQPRRYP